MKDIFEHKNRPGFSKLMWVLPFLMMMAAIAIVFLIDFGFPVKTITRELAAANLVVGAIVLTYRFGVMAINGFMENRLK